MEERILRTDNMQILSLNYDKLETYELRYGTVFQPSHEGRPVVPKVFFKT